MLPPRLPANGLARALALAALCGPVIAQSTSHVDRITSPLRDAGIYNPETKTWTRNRTEDGLGPHAIFNHNAASPYYNPQTANRVQFGEGRIPSTDSEGNQSTYKIVVFQISYCTDEEQALGVDAEWYEFYDSCNFPTTPAVGSYTGTASSLPGTPVTGTQACWIVGINLDDAFFINGDNDAIFDNVPGSEELDAFGWRVFLKGLTPGSSTTGLVIAGDPNNAPFGAGTHPLWGFPPGPEGTGLGEFDQFLLDDMTNDSMDGCFWFGGFQNSGIWGGHWHQLFAETGDSRVCNDLTSGQQKAAGLYCLSSPNSNGEATVAVSNLEVSASAPPPQISLLALNLPVLNGQCSPGAQPGIFIGSSARASIPFFNGTLCLDPSALQRLKPVLFPDANGQVALDVDFGTQAQTPSGACAPLNVVSGALYNFQYWTRDPCALMMGAPTAANFSSAVGVCILP